MPFHSIFEVQYFCHFLVFLYIRRSLCSSFDFSFLSKFDPGKAYIWQFCNSHFKKKKTKGSVKSLDVDKQITMIYLKKSFRTVMIKARHKPPTPVISEETDQSRRVLLKELPGIFCESFHL